MLSTAPAQQAWLAELLAERVEWVTGGPASGPATTVLVVLRSLRLADVVHGAREFASGMAPEEAAAWRRSWTRARFLFGNPANLTPRNRPRSVAPGGSTAWLGPFPDTSWPGLSRLLKPVEGALPGLHRDVELPGTGRRHVLRVAVGGLTLAEYLVHVHHTLAEAVLLGRLGPGEPVRLSHRSALLADPALGRPAYARVLPEPGGTGRLRLHTFLTTDDGAG